MKRYKEPGFQERIGAAARARTGALDQLRAKPPIDEAAAAARLAKEAAKREKRQHALLAAKALKLAKAQDAAAAAAVRQKPVLTEVERKAARDARYLARKKRASS